MAQQQTLKKTIIHKEPIPYNFPMPDVDLLERFVDYSVSADKFDELTAYDGSVVVEQSVSGMLARCDKEEVEFLVLSLSHDMATGKKSVDQARAYYARSIKETMQRKRYPYL